MGLSNNVPFGHRLVAADPIKARTILVIVLITGFTANGLANTISTESSNGSEFRPPGEEINYTLATFGSNGKIAEIPPTQSGAKGNLPANNKETVVPFGGKRRLPQMGTQTEDPEIPSNEVAVLKGFRFAEIGKITRRFLCAVNGNDGKEDDKGGLGSNNRLSHPSGIQQEHPRGRLELHNWETVISNGTFSDFVDLKSHIFNVRNGGISVQNSSDSEVWFLLTCRQDGSVLFSCCNCPQQTPEFTQISCLSSLLRQNHLEFSESNSTCCQMRGYLKPPTSHQPLIPSPSQHSHPLSNTSLRSAKNRTGIIPSPHKVNRVFESARRLLSNSGGFVDHQEELDRVGKVSVLGLFELSTRWGVRPEGHSELAAAQMAIRHINNRRLLPGYTLELLTNDTKVMNDTN